MNPSPINKIEEKKLTCPVPHDKRKPWLRYIKRVGLLGFIFFLVKGLLWILIPYLLSQGILEKYTIKKP